MTFAAARKESPGVSRKDDRAEQGVIDQSIDYSDDVTAEQMARTERAYKHIDKSKLKSTTGAAW